MESPVEIRWYPLTSNKRNRLFHTSVVVNEWEFSYGQMGLSKSIPREVDCTKTLPGSTLKSPKEIDEFLNEARQWFSADSYNILNCNCMDFALELCRFLGVPDKRLETEVRTQNRLAESGIVRYFARWIQRYWGSC